jgi:hypothetical protein
MYPNVSRVSVHRFRDCVAVSVLATNGSGDPVPMPTLYFPQGVARALADFLRDGADSIASETFSASKFGTRIFPADSTV